MEQSGVTKWKTAWIIGASSGIGRALTLELARRGVGVAASARSRDKLVELAQLNAAIAAFPLDVTDPNAVKETHRKIVDRLGPIDLAVLSAGVWHQMGASSFDVAKVAQSMSVNYLGAVNALDALMPAMTARGAGQIVLVASVAGYRGLPKSAAYGPTKAALISLAEVLHPELARKGVRLSVVNPGFVATPMTAVNDFPMPFMISAEDAATRILKGLERGKFEIAFPWQMALSLKLARILPYSLYFWALRTFMAPKSDR